jgi:DNA-binding CsgD family transcriptional regulator
MEFLMNRLTTCTSENAWGHVSYQMKEKGLDLSPREVEAVTYWLCGYSLKESSRKLNVSSRTIEAYRYNAKSKLGVEKKSQLICLMHRSNLLNSLLHLMDEQMGGWVAPGGIKNNLIN